MPKKSPRLLFTDEERQSPELKRAVKKADKAANKLEQAEARIPKKKIKKKQRFIDKKSGKVKTKIMFEEIDKKRPSSNLWSEIGTASAQITAGAAVKVLRDGEDDSAAASAAHSVEKTAETSIRTATFTYRSSKLKPYKDADKAEKQADKANIRALDKQANYQDRNGSNPQSKRQQKRAIKKEYAKAKRSGATTKKASEITKEASKGTAETSKKVVEFIGRHKTTFAVIGGIAAVIVIISCIFSSCSVMFQGASSAIAGSTYPSEDSEMLAAEERYKELEQELSDYISNFESTHSYDEYVYELDDIEHDPYVLVSVLTAIKQGAWTAADVETDLTDLFAKQYTLTEVVTTEQRTGADGSTYDYYICTVTLVNNNLSHIPSDILTQDQLELYATYMKTLGNRPDLFGDSVYVDKYINTEYEDYTIPPEALSDDRFAAMMDEATKYLGYPYVWGGSTPATSFDCSGFVCWVVNHSGWSVGRTTAECLRQLCVRVSPEEARPGDLIFFEGTYDTAGASHVGIYVGDNKMIHCGDPIQYANINSSYFSSHFMQFGRLQ
ncbi:MAG TPA: C40 family peptidase [Candidatus Ornithomonoglobus merdipullorum]|uniref:C40 family peptidase n=1 Tax=Candidatus Ornithomonoglobus merdipullorum TaxID=2840895 RepID=A0A9D1MB12_9FIRM|nr:C40 family peptidase [Candidatus Ornithomonoglobus merdipullorum]